MVIQNRRLISGKSIEESNLLNDPITEIPEHLKRPQSGKAPFHVALTATDAPYSKWQCRIMYYWYKRQKDLPGSDFGGFTRILHSGRSDDLMDEICTYVVDPLPAGLDRGFLCERYLVSGALFTWSTDGLIIYSIGLC